ncbi:MAG: RNA polymerase sigma-70 factor [Balneolaceae bacterium]|nr:RNA polymerase sigma-70 factor [Balneolaceae bacterium]
MVHANSSSDLLGPDNQSEKKWIKAVQRGEKEAFKMIFLTYYDHLTRFAFQYLKSATEAENVVQDVFLWIWEKREDWQVEGTLKTYLFRAVKYKAMDYLRHEEVKRNYLREHSFLDEISINPSMKIEQEIDKKEFIRVTQCAIEDLPERTRIIYKMSRMEGLTYSEIADVLEISTKTVESHMSRALDNLRLNLSKYLNVVLMAQIVATIL